MSLFVLAITHISACLKDTRTTSRSASDNAYVRFERQSRARQSFHDREDHKAAGNPCVCWLLLVSVNDHVRRRDFLLLFDFSQSVQSCNLSRNLLGEPLERVAACPVD